MSVLLRRVVILRREAPTDGPVLSLQPVAPTECGRPIVEDSIPQDVTIEVPRDDGSVSARLNHRVARHAIGAPHPPHDGLRFVRKPIRHANRTGKADTSEKYALSRRTVPRRSRKAA